MKIIYRAFYVKDGQGDLAMLRGLSGNTIILVTHEADIAQWARRRIVFRDGHIVEDRAQPPRTPAEVAA